MISTFLDDLALAFQYRIDRIIRRLRLGPGPREDYRRLLIIQIDGLSRTVLEQALARGRMPFLRRVLGRFGYQCEPMAVGLPTSTPAFQMAMMYGVRPDIPGFHYHDKQRRADVFFPRAGDAALVEENHAGGRRGIVDGGSAYGSVFTGGARDSLFSFAMIKRPGTRGLVQILTAVVVFAWVIVKAIALSSVEIGRAIVRFALDPAGEAARGWRWLLLKIGISVWISQLFTLAVSRDLYAGVPVVYVNYLDYDVFAHAYGPRHSRSLDALRRIDRAIHQLWRILRRVPGYQYDLYVLSDHGQAACQPYERLSGGERLERLFFADLFPSADGTEVRAATQRVARRVASGIKSFRAQRERGIFQRFLHYLENDFPWILGETREAREERGVRIVVAGPNALVYFLEDPLPVPIEWIDGRFPGFADRLSGATGVGLVLARSARGPVCIWRGKRYGLDELTAGPFAERPDIDLVTRGIADLMAMRCSGDLILYGNDAREGNVSYIHGEYGAHAGPSYEELHTFLIHPPDVRIATPIIHPVELYAHFARYQSGEAEG